MIEKLRTALADLPAAANLRPMTNVPVMTHAFFPGGNGLYEGAAANRFPIGGTLILGSNFGCVEKFVNAEGKLLLLDERKGPTWLPLLKLLASAGIERNQCFFTNAWPFLHEGKSNRGPVRSWLRHNALMVSCTEFFRYTLAIMMPKLVIALGTAPAAFLSRIWPMELEPWKCCTWRKVDDLPIATVRFQEQGMILAPITHPSMRNAKHRRSPYKNEDGEIQLLISARLQSEQQCNQGSNSIR